MAVDWTGLLAWSTSFNDGTRESDVRAMSDERKQFLIKALEEATGGVMEDPNDRLKRGIAKMLSESSDIRAEGLDELDSCSDFPDCASNFDKLGGLEAVQHYLEVSCDQGKARCLSVLSLYLANNPVIQEAAYRRGLLTELIRMIQSFSETSTIVDELPYRALSTIGNLIRGVKEVEEGLVAAGGVDLILLCCTLGDERIESKASMLLKHLVSEGRIDKTNALPYTEEEVASD
jgi:hypothetical protein